MIRIEGVSKKFDELLAVDNLSLNIQQGEIFGLLGPNGAGKSTIISMISGQQLPSSGTLQVRGKQPTSTDSKRRIGVAPQTIAMYEELSAMDNLVFFGSLYSLGKEKLKERCSSVLEFVELTERAGDRVENYSGGMKRRLNLAITMMHEPEILLLDEPTVGVDPQSRNKLFENVLALKEQGKTIVYTTHYMEEAERLCDRVGITDLDQTTVSAAFMQRMDEVSELNVEVLPEFEAREATRNGKKVAYIILPAGFGVAYGSLFTGGTPEVVIGVDPTRKAEAGMLQGVMMKLGIERFSNALGDTDQLVGQLDDSITAIAEAEDIPEEWKSLLGEYLPQIKKLTAQEGLGISNAQSTDGGSGIAAALTPLVLNFEDVAIQRDGPKNGYAVTIPQAMYWAMMGVVMGFGVALIQEKTWGTMTRLVVAPLTRMQILGGKAAGCYFALLIVMSILFIFARLVFGVPIDYPIKVLLAIVCVSSGFVGLMMFLAALGKSERGMASLGWGVMMVFAMFGGAMIPLFAMPDWMKTVSNFSPVKWAILSFEGATWRGFSYAELLLPCGIMLVMGVVLFFAGSRILKLED